jgi:hypothetical protein
MNTTKNQTATVANTEKALTAIGQFAKGLKLKEQGATMINSSVQTLQGLGVVVGALGRKAGTGCPYAVHFVDTMVAEGYSKDYARNQLVTLRDALKTGQTVKDSNKSRAKAKASKPQTTKGTKATPKTTCDKIREQLKNVLSIVQGDKDPKGFDPVEITKSINAILATLK